jgi:predicted DNA-binding protein with PD1-like motif
VTTWVVGEVIIYEITGARVARVKDAKTGFRLLQPGA